MILLGPGGWPYLCSWYDKCFDPPLPAFLTTFEDGPELSGSSIRASTSQRDGGGELNASDLNTDTSLMDQDSNSDSDWVDLDFEMEDGNVELHGEKDLDDEMELEQVAMEDGITDGFDNSVFGHKYTSLCSPRNKQGFRQRQLALRRVTGV